MTDAITRFDHKVNRARPVHHSSPDAKASISMQPTAHRLSTRPGMKERRLLLQRPSGDQYRCSSPEQLPPVDTTGHGGDKTVPTTFFSETLAQSAAQ